MENITLEKVDMVIERTRTSYEMAKNALEASNGDVLEAIIYIERLRKECEEKSNSESPMTIDELKSWFKEVIEKGNVTRIKIKKDDAELIDIPVNAGIAVGVIAIIMPAVLAAGVIAAIATKITIEITREDGTVEVVNKYVSDIKSEVKSKASIIANKIKNKVSDVKNDNDYEEMEEKHKVYGGGKSVYSYTVKFDEEDNK